MERHDPFKRVTLQSCPVSGDSRWWTHAVGIQLRDLMSSRSTQWRIAILMGHRRGKQEEGVELVSRHQIQPGDGKWEG